MKIFWISKHVQVVTAPRLLSLLLVLAILSAGLEFDSFHPTNYEGRLTKQSDRLSDEIRLKFYRPQPSHLSSIVLMTLFGTSGELISLYIENNTLVAQTQLSADEDATYITIPLPDDGQEVTVQYTRFIGTLYLYVNNYKITKPLIGRAYKFNADWYELGYHGLICISTVTYNTQALLQYVRYPNCDLTLHQYELSSPVIMNLYEKESVPLKPCIPQQLLICEAEIVSFPKCGEVINGVYKQTSSSCDATGDSLWIYFTCADNSVASLKVQVIIAPVEIVGETTASVMLVNQSTIITPDILNVKATHSQYVDAPKLEYRINKDGLYGTLLLDRMPVLNKKFSDDHLRNLSISYEVYFPTVSSFTDTVILEVSLAGTDSPIELFSLMLVYEPVMNFSQNKVLVVEGEKTTLTPEHLWARYGFTTDFEFLVIVDPMFGRLQRKGFSYKVEKFSSAELSSGDIIYQHDSSESEIDRFSIRYNHLANNSINGTAVIQIEVQLVNDNPPLRVTKPKLEVILHMDTMITSADLGYSDKDKHQRPGDISIERQGIFCGEIISKASGKPLYKFTQKDVDQREVVFRHSGTPNCHLVAWISDGKNTISDIVLIEAVEPALSINGSKNITLQYKEAVINSSVLHIETNTKFLPSEILMYVNDKPKYGKTTLTDFTYQDLIDGKLLYKQKSIIGLYDSFSLKIKIGEREYNETVYVMFHPDPTLVPEVLHNKPLLGQADEIVSISNDQLLVFNSKAKPEEIVYSVVTPGESGSFMIGQALVTQFTQADINFQQLSYKLGDKDDTVFLRTGFLDHHVEINLHTFVIQDGIPVSVQSNISTLEGGAINLSPDIIAPMEPMLQNSLMTIQVIKRPQHGTLLSSNIEKDSFSSEDLTSNLVVYRHDGSETVYDEFFLQLKYINGYTSRPSRIQVQVEPVNDNFPFFNSSRTLKLWKDELTPLTSKELSVTDKDSNSLPTTIAYELVTQLECGKLLRNGAPVEYFTQGEVNTGSIVFDLSDGCDYLADGLVFIISDGLFYEEIHIATEIVNRKESIIEVFPSKPYMLSKHLPSVESVGQRDYEIELAPEHGVILRADDSSYVNQSIKVFSNSWKVQFMPLVSKHLTNKLCRNVGSQVLHDKFIITYIDGGRRERMKIGARISFLNVASVLKQEPVILDMDNQDRVTIGPTHHLTDFYSIAAAISVCKSPVRLGLTIAEEPKLGHLGGYDKHGIVWWEDILAEKFQYFSTASFSGSQYEDRIILGVILEQNKNRYPLDGVMIELEITNKLKAGHLENIINHSPSTVIHLLQGEQKALVKLTGIIDKKSVNFTILESPRYGVVLVNDMKAEHFTAEDLAEDKVVYKQDELVSSDDLLIRASDCNHREITIKLRINVKPNVKSAPIIISVNEPTPITTHSLDASPLLTGTSRPEDIQYEITQPPQFGYLELQLTKEKRAVDSVQMFTHANVIDGVVLYYPPPVVPIDNQDGFTYTLHAPGVQPADGTFTVTFNKTALEFQSQPINSQPVLGIGTITAITVTLSVALAVLILLITVICLRKVRETRNIKAKASPSYDDEPRLILAKENGSYKLLIAGCDDFAITPHSLPPSPTRCIDTNKSTEYSSTVPEVRVTPLLYTDGLDEDLHDYVNYDDMYKYRSQRSSINNSILLDYNQQDGTSFYSSSSIENIPHIKRPNYSC